MKVQEEIRQHHHNAVAAVNRHRMPKDAFPDLRFSNEFAYAGHVVLNPNNHRMIAIVIPSRANDLAHDRGQDPSRSSK
jgi:hypothetical protein